ncbi:MBL fold metallo-hydrolase [Faunimonas sp. B44]|uniref:MBL fold metallo-hydrolase n=1 Tax=Faunimonas sp. B44 TaxID=3461493 RepID=UPI0040441D05
MSALNRGAGRRQPIALSRRELLAGGAAVAALAAMPLALRPAFAAEPHRIAVGEMELTVVSDGNLVLRPAKFIAPEADEAEFEALMQAYDLPLDEVKPACNVALLRNGDRLVLFDAGSGARFMESAGRLVDNLGAAGIDPSEVTDVVFTHGHPDHLWGVLDDFDEEVFSEASYHVARPEWDFWMADDVLSRLPETAHSFAAGAQRNYEAIEDRVTFFEAGQEILPGVEAVESFGHTPGHVSFELRSGSDALFLTGDAITHRAVSFERPDWASSSDHDRDMGARTRARLLDRLATEKTTLLGFHLPYPGIGHAERKDRAYRFVPA